MGKGKKATKANSTRGFATTSTPSKAKNVVPKELTDKEKQKEKEQVVKTSTKVLTDSTNITPEKTESQRYIEKLRELNSKKVEAYFEDIERLKNKERSDNLPALKLDVNIEQAVIRHIKKIGYQDQGQLFFF